jgi:hypothetical protein
MSITQKSSRSSTRYRFWSAKTSKTTRSTTQVISRGVKIERLASLTGGAP